MSKKQLEDLFTKPQRFETPVPLPRTKKTTPSKDLYLH